MPIISLHKGLHCTSCFCDCLKWFLVQCPSFKKEECPCWKTIASLLGFATLPCSEVLDISLITTCLLNLICWVTALDFSDRRSETWHLSSLRIVSEGKSQTTLPIQLTTMSQYITLEIMPVHPTSPLWLMMAVLCPPPAPSTNSMSSDITSM